MNRRDIPNLISLLRIVLVAPVVFFLLQENFMAALIIFIVASVSDALDGYLAKRYGWSSQLGSFLDPLADKLLLVSVFSSCVIVGIVPLWLLVAVFTRDVIVGIGAAIYHFFIEEFKGTPPFSSKLNTALQALYLVLVIANQELLQLPEAWMLYLVYCVAGTTVISGIEYVWVWGMRAWERMI